MTEQKDDVQEKKVEVTAEEVPQDKKTDSSKALASDKKITITLNSSMVTLICDVFVLLCVIIKRFLWTLDNAATASDVFTWLGGIVLIIGLTFYIIKLIKDRKLQFSPMFVLQLFTFYVFV